VTTNLVYINAGSPFSQEVFRRLRPVIPRERWPTGAMTITFTADSSGLFLLGNFDGDDLPPSYAATAVRVLAQAGVDLVVLSPFAAIASGAMQAKRWRDVFMYMLAPLLFAIPLLGALAEKLMFGAAALFGADILALVFAQIIVTQRRMAMVNGRFVAEIPVPGMRVNVARKEPTGLHLQETNPSDSRRN
jgi:uncharacterized membrane protein YhaH (DUF805 family)